MTPQANRTPVRLSHRQFMVAMPKTTRLGTSTASTMVRKRWNQKNPCTFTLTSTVRRLITGKSTCMCPEYLKTTGMTTRFMTMKFQITYTARKSIIAAQKFTRTETRIMHCG
ncbi:MAG TPA: hypothetical protein VIB39_19290 [Candidatus Angelobacter sp.]